VDEGDHHVGDRFDRYRNSYEDEVQRSISFSGQDVGFFADVKAAYLAALARRELGTTTVLDVLDVGCGVGVTDSYLEGTFRSISGVDVSEGSIDAATSRNPWGSYRAYDGRTLPFEDGRFDLTFAICVVHHVAPADRVSFIEEMARVTRPGGIVAVVEHNPYNPMTRLAVARCDFDEGVILERKGGALAILRGARLRIVGSPYLLFFPWRGRAFRAAERALTWLPMGAQYAVAGRRV
jgi:SAM-dependent methyltransferase